MTSYEVENRQWWVERWLELLDSYRFKKRLERARIYAREGNVLSIEFAGAEVIAKVQGSEIEPYQVALSLNPFTNEDWHYIIETMSQKAIFSAQLLAGEMPENIEQVFIANGLSLFPFSLSDIHSRCSCPDKANPCKHIGAVYYQLADHFSEDPFVIFQLRGKTQSQIIEALRQLRSQKAEVKQLENAERPETEAELAVKKTKTKTVKKTENIDLVKFWQYNEPLESSLVVIAPLPESKNILDILGTIPLAYNDAQAVKQYLAQVYPQVSQQAIATALQQGT